jgi:hypothetical protein
MNRIVQASRLVLTCMATYSTPTIFATHELYVATVEVGVGILYKYSIVTLLAREFFKRSTVILHELGFRI